MKRLPLLLAVPAIVLCLGPLAAAQEASHAPSSAASQTQPATSAPSAAVNPAPAAAHVEQPIVTKYTLPPDRYAKARAINRIRLWATLIGFVYGLVVLWLVLYWKLAPKYRTWAEKASARRFLQALVFTPLLLLTIDILGLPTDIFRNWLSRKYGISIQGWGSWFLDWMKSEIISIIILTILIWILYAVIHKSPRRWWFYFWLAAIPILLLVFFLQPLIIDPLFYKFEPLAQKDPALTASLERIVQRAGENIPPERMYWMNAGKKLTALNAYVTGFGASKRIVVWDTTINKLNTPQIVFVAGHEMGHYVLWHIPKLIAFTAGLLLLFFYLLFRTVGWVLTRWGVRWEIRGLDDWASLPVLMLLLSIFVFLGNPITSAVGRHYEHQADQYGLEVTHGLTPDSGQVAAQSFQILGDVNLADPEPNPVAVFLYYDHPPIPDRVQFCLTYDPWSKGGQGEFVK
ncbi:MAG TPA: M48 family metallopeptidase [Terriglobales bacterium]|jgi:Zn-dependent protease with chaperone function|nr:M48 family metallopeptidase [Terriglobales bacterium]